MLSFFVSDLHGKKDRYEKLAGEILSARPKCVFMGGDLFPNHFVFDYDDFITVFFPDFFSKIKTKLMESYPEFYLILGNDDAGAEIETMLEYENSGLFTYIHNRKKEFGEYEIYGYANIPPSPFLLKDWERYDVSRFVDPGCIPPDEGKFTIEPDLQYIRNATIETELGELCKDCDFKKSVFLFHSPPYQTLLDRAALDGKKVDHVPLDVNIGSIAIKKFIQKNQPLIALHGHVHESTRLTGQWKEQIGRTHCFQAATDSKELSLIKFNMQSPENAERVLI